MTNYLLAGGGTAGHVNPLLAVAERIRTTEPGARITVLGTADGFEASLVPERGFDLALIERTPLPRRLTADFARFPGRLRRATRGVEQLLSGRAIDVVVGFGGYVAAPAYLAARSARLPLVIHEANVIPGLANRIAARWTRHVGVTFPGTRLAHAQLVGMPLRGEIEHIARDSIARQAARLEAAEVFGLEIARPTILVTGGSQGSRRINDTVSRLAPAIIERGYNLLHLGGKTLSDAHRGLAGYRALAFTHQMHLALARADLVVARAGAGTVSELAALGIPALYVPYPTRDRHQTLNAAHSVRAGSALMVPDHEFTPDRGGQILMSLLDQPGRLASLADAARANASLDGTDATLRLIHSALV